MDNKVGHKGAFYTPKLGLRVEETKWVDGWMDGRGMIKDQRDAHHQSSRPTYKYSHSDFGDPKWR